MGHQARAAPPQSLGERAQVKSSSSPSAQAPAATRVDRVLTPTDANHLANSRPGENRLAIRFDPPLAHAGPRDPEQWSSTPAERVWMRKAQYGFGWDWGPRLPTIGIWRLVALRREREAVPTRVNFSTLAIGRDALVAVDVEAERFTGDAELEASIQLRSPGGGQPARATVTCATVGRPHTSHSPTRRCGGRTTSASRRCTTCASC